MYEYRAIVRRVVDGDTVDVDIDLGFDVWLKYQRIRLYGIDAPETRTRDLEEKERGLASKAFVENLLPVNKEITIKTYLDDRGKYGRILGILYMDPDKPSVNDLLLENGLATPY